MVYRVPWVALSVSDKGVDHALYSESKTLKDLPSGLSCFSGTNVDRPHTDSIVGDRQRKPETRPQLLVHQGIVIGLDREFRVFSQWQLSR